MIKVPLLCASLTHAGAQYVGAPLGCIPSTLLGGIRAAPSVFLNLLSSSGPARWYGLITAAVATLAAVLAVDSGIATRTLAATLIPVIGALLVTGDSATRGRLSASTFKTLNTALSAAGLLAAAVIASSSGTATVVSSQLQLHWAAVAFLVATSGFCACCSLRAQS